MSAGWTGLTQYDPVLGHCYVWLKVDDKNNNNMEL